MVLIPVTLKHQLLMNIGHPVSSFHTPLEETQIYSSRERELVPIVYLAEGHSTSVEGRVVITYLW